MNDVAASAAAKVRQAIAAGTPLPRKDVERALREVFGLSARQAKRFCAEGFRSLTAVDESSELAALAMELAERLRL